MNTSRLLVLLLTLGSCFSTSAADINVSGYLKSYVLALDEIDTPFLKTDNSYQSQNAMRLMVDVFAERLAFQVHYEVAPVWLSSATLPASTFAAVRNSWRLSDIKNPLTESDRQITYQNLDRFNVQLQLDAGDLTIGRQPITFGSARMINPSDVFLPFDVRTLNTEYRHGVDAVRFQKPLGMLGEFDVGVILGDDVSADDSAAFVQVKTHVASSDLRFAVMEYARQRLLAVGLESALGDFGFWFEAADVSGDQNYWRLSTGLDYAPTETTFVMVEYHFNDAGGDDLASYVSNAQQPAYNIGGVFLLGRQYLLASFSWTATPLLGLSASSTYNLSDDSAFLSLSGSYNIREDVYLGAGIYLFEGKSLATEYGDSPATAYLSLRYYF